MFDDTAQGYYNSVGLLLQRARARIENMENWGRISQKRTTVFTRNTRYCALGAILEDRDSMSIPMALTVLANEIVHRHPEQQFKAMSKQDIITYYNDTPERVIRRQEWKHAEILRTFDSAIETAKAVMSCPEKRMER